VLRSALRYKGIFGGNHDAIDQPAEGLGLMARSILLLLSGAIAGAAIIYSVFGQGSAGFESVSPEPVESGNAIGAARVTQARIAVYQQTMQATDTFDLESMIGFAAAAPRSHSRDFELTALLGRLAELDPLRAADFAQSAFLETRLLVQAFEALAKVDPDTAIVKLSSVTPAARQRRIALAMLEIIGNDEQGVARLVAALPEEDEVSFEIDALLARAESDPLGTVRALLEIDRATIQSLTLASLAEIVAREDPRGALALAESIDDPNLRRSFQQSVLNAWSQTDTNGLFEFLETAEPALLASSFNVVQAVADSDPDRLLAMLDRFPPAARSAAMNAVTQAVAERDPIEAIAMLDTMTPGQDKENMLQIIAEAYGRDNPDLALAWVKSLTPRSDSAMRAVLQGIVQADVDRAIDIMIAELDEQRSGSYGIASSLTNPQSFSMTFSLLASSGAEVGRLVDRLLEVAGPQSSATMSSVVSLWASRDSNAALNWALANSDRLDALALRNVSRQIAEANLDLAISTLDRLPPEQRAGWLEGLVGRIVQQDVDQAISFVERYRGQPGFNEAFGAVLSQIAQTDPTRAAGMLRSAPDSNSTRTATFAIYRQWANRDPAGAARWAMNEIGDSQLRTTAINEIASTWAAQDSAAAERWIYSLTSGPTRDAAISGLLSTAALVGQFKPGLLDAYSSEAAGQRGASSAIVQVGRTDPDEAARLLDLYVTDPAIRVQAQEELARNSSVSAGIIVSGGNVIIRQ
jgi:hypothetical protein